jgi:hypothetical protein
MMHMEINDVCSQIHNNIQLYSVGKKYKIFHYTKSGDTGSKLQALIG